MRLVDVAATLLALVGIAFYRGALAGWPFSPRSALLLVLPLLVVAGLHVRAARERRLRRYSLGW